MGPAESGPGTCVSSDWWDHAPRLTTVAPSTTFTPSRDRSRYWSDQAICHTSQWPRILNAAIAKPFHAPQPRKTEIWPAPTIPRLN